MRPLPLALLVVAGLSALLLNRPPGPQEAAQVVNTCQSTRDGLKCDVPKLSMPSVTEPAAAAAVAPEPTPTPLPTATPVPSKWGVSTSVSPVDDSQTVVLSLPAENRIPGRYRDTHLPVLMLRCQEGKTEAYIAMDTFLGSEETSVTFRLDREKAVTRTWGISTDHDAMFVRGGHVAFVKQLMNHDELFVRMTPYGESPVSASFDLRGLKEAVKPLQAACKWK